jgi:hypothetical protein
LELKIICKYRTFPATTFAIGKKAGSFVLFATSQNVGRCKMARAQAAEFKIKIQTKRRGGKATRSSVHRQERGVDHALCIHTLLGTKGGCVSQPSSVLRRVRAYTDHGVISGSGGTVGRFFTENHRKMSGAHPYARLIDPT